MKHAYLIIAHHEFEILTRLVEALDDPRNDIFIHFDKKVAELPSIRAEYSKLYILEKRIDVRWGDVSQIESEIILFEQAVKQGPYAYYHILSGVDMPLKSQDFIHNFFTQHEGKEFIGFNQEDSYKDISRKVQRYHLYPKNFRFGQGIRGGASRLLRFAFLRIQFIFFPRRNKQTLFRKGLNWVSVTQKFVLFLLEKKVEIIKNYQYTFCADEIFLQTVCWNSSFREKLFDPDNEGRGCMRLIGWKNNELVDWEDKDFEMLMNSDALFARKFNTKHIGVVDRILNRVKAYA